MNNLRRLINAFRAADHKMPSHVVSSAGRIKLFILRISVLTARSREEIEALSSRSTIAYGLSICMVLFLAGFGMFSWTAKDELARWEKPAPELLLPKSGWKVLYADSEIPCGDDARGSGCIADPAVTTLWDSPFTRADKDHSAKVRTRKGKTFWLGYQIPASQLKEAHKLDANKVVLGWIGAGFRVWVNGMLREKGHVEKVPVGVSIDFTDMASGNDVRLAIEIKYDTEALFPVGLNRGAEALASSSSSSRNFQKEMLAGETLPLISATANLIIALLFLFFWLTAPVKHEYLWLSIFCFAQFVAHVSTIKFVYSNIGYGYLWAVWLTNYSLEAVFGLILAAAFARAKNIVYKVMVPAALLIPAFLYFTAASVETLGIYSHYAVRIVIPCAYLIGAAFVLVQHFHLKTTTPVEKLQERKRVMLLFSVGMILMALGYYAKGYATFSDEKHQIVFRYVHTAIVSFLSFLVLMDYRRQAELVRTFKTSRYHLAGRAGEWINGALLQVDLKGSTAIAEELKNRNGDNEIYGQFVRKWYDYFTSAAESFGGEILNEAGDAISIFFDDGHGHSRLEHILPALQSMIASHSRVMTEFGFQKPLHLRASIVWGTIQPCWKGQGGSSRPGWDGTILIDSARILELEREVPENTDCSVVVIESNKLYQPLPEGYQILSAGQTFTDKDKTKRKVAALKLATYQNFQAFSA